MTMHWDDVRIFLAVARAGNLSAAAKRLKVTQPTVGRRLKGLEQTLGARLFDRLPDGFQPTAAGTELLPLAEAMERTALTVGRRQLAFAETARGSVRISAWEVLAQFLTNHLTELRARLPDIEIEIAVEHIHANLTRREADLLVRECLPENPGLVARKVGRYTFAVYGSRDFVAAHPESRGDARYQACAWVGFDEDHAYFHNQSWLLDRLGGRQPAVRTNNGMVLHQSVCVGTGLGVLPCFAADADPALVRLTAPIGELRRDLHLVLHRDLRRSPAVRAVINALAEIFRRETPRLLGEREEAA